jgi:hypothetical protein
MRSPTLRLGTPGRNVVHAGARTRGRARSSWCRRVPARFAVRPTLGPARSPASPNCEGGPPVNGPTVADLLIVWPHDMESSMRLFGLPIAVTLLALLVGPAAAQEVGRSQDGFYSGEADGQYSGQWSGQVNPRVDGRPSRNEGLPPSAADKGNRRFDNPIDSGVAQRRKC